MPKRKRKKKKKKKKKDKKSKKKHKEQLEEPIEANSRPGTDEEIKMHDEPREVDEFRPSSDSDDGDDNPAVPASRYQSYANKDVYQVDDEQISYLKLKSHIR